MKKLLKIVMVSALCLVLSCSSGCSKIPNSTVNQFETSQSTTMRTQKNDDPVSDNNASKMAVNTIPLANSVETLGFLKTADDIEEPSSDDHFDFSIGNKQYSVSRFGYLSVDGKNTGKNIIEFSGSLYDPSNIEDVIISKLNYTIYNDDLLIVFQWQEYEGGSTNVILIDSLNLSTIWTKCLPAFNIGGFIDNKYLYLVGQWYKCKIDVKNGIFSWEFTEVAQLKTVETIENIDMENNTLIVKAKSGNGTAINVSIDAKTGKTAGNIDSNSSSLPILRISMPIIEEKYEDIKLNVDKLLYGKYSYMYEYGKYPYANLDVCLDFSLYTYDKFFCIQPFPGVFVLRGNRFVANIVPASDNQIVYDILPEEITSIPPNEQIIQKDKYNTLKRITGDYQYSILSWQTNNAKIKVLTASDSSNKDNILRKTVIFYTLTSLVYQ